MTVKLKKKSEFSYFDAEDVFRKISMVLALTKELAASEHDFTDCSTEAKMGLYLTINSVQEEYEVFKEYYWNKLDKEGGIK